MSKNPLLLLSLFLLTACSKSPEEYRLSAAQLVWQSYRVNQVLRFGHAQDAKVRIYRITDVRDEMVKAHRMAVIGLPFKAPDQSYQEITVEAQRTDTTAQSQKILAMGLDSYDEGTKNPPLVAEIIGESFFHAFLPIDAVNSGTLIDTVNVFTYMGIAYPGTRLLARATLGATTYQQVVYIADRNVYGPSPAGFHRVRDLYYTREQGLVGYREDGTGLWYRLL